MHARFILRLVGLGCAALVALAMGCKGLTMGDATPVKPVESEFAGDASSIGDTDTVPILSIIGQPLTDELQAVTPAVPVPAAAITVAAAPPDNRTISVLAGSDIWFEFQPKKRGQRWYRGFTIQLVDVTTVLGPPRTWEQVIAKPNASWTWTEQSPPSSGNMSSARVIEVPTLGQSEPGVYLAVFKITPFQPLDNNGRRDGYPLEKIGVVIVKR